MIGSTNNLGGTTFADSVSNEDAFTLRVEGTTCIHRAEMIGSAVEQSLPGTRIVADPGSGSNSATGMSDRGKPSAIVGEQATTPQCRRWAGPVVPAFRRGLKDCGQLTAGPLNPAQRSAAARMCRGYRLLSRLVSAQ